MKDLGSDRHCEIYGGWPRVIIHFTFLRSLLTVTIDTEKMGERYGCLLSYYYCSVKYNYNMFSLGGIIQCTTCNIDGTKLRTYN